MVGREEKNGEVVNGRGETTRLMIGGVGQS